MPSSSLPGDLAAEGGLGDVQGRGGAAEAAALRDGDERFEEIQLHRCPMVIAPRLVQSSVETRVRRADRTMVFMCDTGRRRSHATRTDDNAGRFDPAPLESWQPPHAGPDCTPVDAALSLAVAYVHLTDPPFGERAVKPDAACLEEFEGLYPRLS